MDCTLFLWGLRAFAVKSHSLFLLRVSPLRRLAFCEVAKRQQKKLSHCAPDSGSKSLYAAPLPDRIVCCTDSVGLRFAALDRL